MDLKSTLLMPKTDFEMRGNLAKKEPIIIERWEKEDIYSQLLNKNKGKESFSFHDGPPYANGNIHCGHMLNRLLKDFIVKYKSMSGFYTPFIFGFDTHGLPIENQVIKKGVNRKTTPVVEFREKCAEYAHTQVNNQSLQIKRLGVFGDLKHPYLTLNKDFEAGQLECFSIMALKGLIYKGLKPVYWSPSSESALAEAELEYKDVESHSIYVSFKLKENTKINTKDVSLIIWTTTPWTLPSNLAISVNPHYEYGVYETNIGNILILKEFSEKLKEELNLTKMTLLEDVKGRQLEYLEYIHPLYERKSIVILGEHVTNEAGTGLVHTAPGHGADDYVVCKKYNIEPYCPVDEKGVLTKEAGECFEGVFYEKANDIVISKLTECNALIKSSKFIHSYPHDWRTKKPVIFRATPQWFCSIEKIKPQLINEVKNIKWIPSWGEQRMINMIKDRSDWCISRQRVWGLPIPIIYCEDGTPIIDKEVFDHITELVKIHGSKIWYELSANELLPQGYKNKLSPNDIYTKEKDIMDVWFDSGSSFHSVIQQRGSKFPCDLYLEGSDQYRGWFNSSLTISVACFSTSPYKTCISHGWVLDENSAKMSKSQGNGIDPSKVANTYGSDILRLWVSTIDYKQDVRISDSIIAQISDQYRKIRNTFKFLLGTFSNGTLQRFNPTKDKVNSYEIVDKFILAKLEQLTNEVIDDYDNYEFSGVITKIMNFISNELSSFYLDISKDILYCNGVKDIRRLQVQNVIFKVCNTLMRLLTPILSFTMEEIYQNMPNFDGKSVCLLDFPKKSYEFDKEVLQQFEEFKILRNNVLKQLEIARTSGIIGSSQEALVILKDHQILKDTLLINNLEELARLLIVSKIEINPSIENVEVHHINAHKCPRCWNYVDELLSVDEETSLCKRCKEVVENL